MRLMILIAALVTCFCSGLCAQEPTQDDDAITVLLTFQPSSSISGYVNADNRTEVRFKKEPDFGDRSINRGALFLDKEKEHFIGYAYDEKNGTLHLDLNQNLDLTDDPDGECHTTIPISSFFMAPSRTDFPIALHVNHNNVPVSYNLQLTFWEILQSVQVQSGWEGWFTLNGTTYWVGVKNNLDNAIDHRDQMAILAVPSVMELARPPEEQLSPQELRHVREDAQNKNLGVTDYLCLGGRCYSPSWQFIEAGQDGAVELTLTEVKTGLGRLEIVENNVESILISGDTKEAYVEASDAPLQIPSNIYSVSKVYLKGDFASLDCPVATFGILEGQTTTLPIGQHLTPGCTIERAGNTLKLNYVLKGTYDERYFAIGRERVNPTFAVYQGKTKVASGKFEYG